MFSLCYSFDIARLARIVAPGYPHHVTARGNRREPIFFEDGDQDLYCDLLAEQMRKAKVEVWAYCLMPNHVHLVLTPSAPDGLARAVGEAHRRYAGFINARGRWRGHLFEGRFASVVMDDTRLMAAVRYVSLNPVRARLVGAAEDWPWSSVRAHLEGRDNGLAKVGPILGRIENFRELIAVDDEADRRHAPALQALRAAETTGRALAAPDLVAEIERLLGRRIARRAPGRGRGERWRWTQSLGA